LFTFNCKDIILQEMAGTSFEKAEVKINQTKLKENGALLITHWGLSGPAILRLSAWGAKDLAKLNYSFDLQVNWIGQKSSEVQSLFLSLKKDFPNKQISNIYFSFNLNKRFWNKILVLAQLDSQITMAQLSNKNINLLIEILTNYSLKINGKSTFKDEFVTCGGVELKEVDFKTMQSKIVPNLYFVGEVLDIDAITGGFNFQAAWSGAFILSEHLRKGISEE
ncbi:MAG TPA: aminoacetone oxidase family FAD-binding enzyme, partial [Flavobacterium sp.]|nr:aminoacetone oxidase family FAD-binding enzyme [Flavobacterium sp.]